MTIESASLSRPHSAFARSFAGDVAELFVGPIFHRWLLRSRPFDAEWVTAHVERVLRSVGAG
jgi:hypothetical protein